MSALNAKITAVNIGIDSLTTSIAFCLRDGEDTGTVSFCDTINQAHACFLSDFGLPATDNHAYAQMLSAIVNSDNDDLLAMVGREFVSGDDDESGDTASNASIVRGYENGGGFA